MQHLAHRNCLFLFDFAFHYIRDVEVPERQYGAFAPLARALGGALGGAAHPRPQEAPNLGDVRRREAASAVANSRQGMRGSNAKYDRLLVPSRLDALLEFLVLLNFTRK
jgi:hypothetical protein